MKQDLGLRQAVNYGICGTRIADQRTPVPDRPASFEKYFASRVAEMAPGADLVVIFGGTNDYEHGDALPGQMSDRTPDTFYGALHLLILRLMEKYPTTPLVFLTPLHRQGESEDHVKVSADGQTVCHTTLSTYVEIIREVAAYYAIPVCDLFTISGIQPELPQHRALYCPDGLHPNAAGQRLIADRLEGFLRTL
jgi:lysophospholipase L1-like esterase